mmetsp:Transcript_93384/g.269712  ORF Transcript_93384/g.269712 Transcript_93384/m.269712 type:complete len:481 (-) Transcript_93384:155-1597(-)
MEACWCGALGGKSDVLSTTSEVVVPSSAGERSQVPLSEMESGMFSAGPLACASFPAIALRLRSCDPGLLKSSLATALARHRVLAGRIKKTFVELSDEGVPFTVVESSKSSAPKQIREPDLLQLADFRRAPRVSSGSQPPCTVLLTRYRDGSGVLTFCRSHVLMDGTSAWAFIGDWARAARGEPLVAGRAVDIVGEAPDRAEVDAMWMEEFGEPMADWGVTLKKAALKGVLHTVAPVADLLFLSGTTGDLERPRAFFSDDDLAAIKVAATPSGDGSWVSTQEALSAYLVLTAGKTLLKADSRGRVTVAYILDPRKALGRSSNETFGAGLVIMRMAFDGLLQMSLQDVAGKIHDAAQSEMSLKKVGRRWRLSEGCFKHGVEFCLLSKTMPRKWENDVTLVLNNQSKRELPDFGEAASGGRAEAVVTNAGPTIVLPAKGGVDVLLDPTTLLRAARSARDRARVVDALRANMPRPTRAAEQGGA